MDRERCEREKDDAFQLGLELGLIIGLGLVCLVIVLFALAGAR